MPLSQRIETFAGLPVVEFPDGDRPADPAVVAWRIEDVPESEGMGFIRRSAHFARQEWASQVTALVIGRWSFHYLSFSPIRQLVQVAPALGSLRHLFLGDIPSEESDLYTEYGDITALLSAYPRLETLVIRGSEGLWFEPGRYESLRSLTIQSGALPGDVVQTFAKCDMPNLTHLELWLGTNDYGDDATVDALRPILTGSRLPALTSLGLRNAQIADQVAAALASAPIVARLQELDLSLGMLGDEGATALLAGQPLTHLRRLDLHHHYISEPVMERIVAELGAAGVEVILPEPAKGRFWGDRYIAMDDWGRYEEATE